MLALNVVRKHHLKMSVETTRTPQRDVDHVGTGSFDNGPFPTPSVDFSGAISA